MKVVDAQENVDKIKAEHQNIEAQEKAARKRVADRRKELGDARKRLSGLEQSKTTVLSVYHDAMPAVVAEINRQKNLFKDPPIGPLGISVRLKKEEWAGICENLFGRNLNAFLVTNHKDKELMLKILKDKNAYPSYDCTTLILVGTFRLSFRIPNFIITNQVNRIRNMILSYEFSRHAACSLC